MTELTVTPSSQDEQDYSAILEAVMETARGRWFLQQYAHRNRVSETDRVIDALGEMETRLAEQSASVQMDADGARLRLSLADMSQTIEALKYDLNQMRTDGAEQRETTAAAELDAITKETEVATSEILEAAESIQEIAFELSEENVSQETCDRLEELITRIYTACSFQDLTGQRIAKIIRITKFIDDRVKNMITQWEDEVGVDTAESSKPSDQPSTVHDVEVSEDEMLRNGPALPGEGIEQNYIDSLMNEPNAQDVVDWVDSTESDLQDASNTSMEEVEVSAEDHAAWEADFEEEVASGMVAEDEATQIEAGASVDHDAPSIDLDESEEDIPLEKRQVMFG